MLAAANAWHKQKPHSANCQSAPCYCVPGGAGNAANVLLPTSSLLDRCFACHALIVTHTANRTEQYGVTRLRSLHSAIAPAQAANPTTSTARTVSRRFMLLEVSALGGGQVPPASEPLSVTLDRTVRYAVLSVAEGSGASVSVGRMSAMHYADFERPMLSYNTHN